MYLFSALEASWRDLPLAWTLPVLLYLGWWILYTIFAPRCSTEKQRAYILSTLSSFVMSMTSLPFVWDYATKGLGSAHVVGQEGWRGDLAQFGMIFFGVYLFADLSLGFLKYPSQIGMLTGWVHHIVYIGLMFYSSYFHQGPVFMIGAVMEIPTFDLAISNLFPSIRNDVRFLSGFFAVRILYNFVYWADLALHREATGGSIMPTIVLLAALGMHVSWFRGGLHGYLKRRRAAARALKTEIAGAGEKDTTTTKRDVAISADAVVYTAVTLDPTISSTLLPPASSSTPDDSPLITPYTPGTTPMSIRDSYLFPNIQIPTFPNLPAVHIPALSFSDLTASLPRPPTLPRDMNFGFKDAVKQRWDEQRERFEGMRGRGGFGGVGGLGLRRRGAAAKNVDSPTQISVHEVVIAQEGPISE